MKRPLEDIHIAFLAEEQYEDLELWYPLLRMEEAGAKTTVLGIEGVNQYQGKHGYQVTPNAHLKEVSADDFDALIIAGGDAPLQMRGHPTVCSLVEKMYTADKALVLIGTASLVAISADVVRGKQVTSAIEVKDDLINAGALWDDKAVVQDGLLFSARRTADLPKLCAQFIETMSNHLLHDPTRPKETIDVDDPVDEVSWESFPASDPPPY